MTQFDAAQIERIVREVLAEMGAAPAQRAPTDALPAEPGCLVWSARVVTAAELNGRLQGVRQIVVAPRAVVTPAAADLLRQAGVAIVREESPRATAGQASSGAQPDTGRLASAARVCLIGATRSFDASALADVLARDGLAVFAQQKDCLIASAEELARCVADRHTVGVLVTRKASAALCLANRKSGVRAILASSADSLDRDADEVGANVLVVDPRSRGLFAVRWLVRRFAASGVRRCPEVLEKNLG